MEEQDARVSGVEKRAHSAACGEGGDSDEATASPEASHLSKGGRFPGKEEVAQPSPAQPRRLMCVVYCSSGSCVHNGPSLHDGKPLRPFFPSSSRITRSIEYMVHLFISKRGYNSSKIDM